MLCYVNVSVVQFFLKKIPNTCTSVLFTSLLSFMNLLYQRQIKPCKKFDGPKPYVQRIQLWILDKVKPQIFVGPQSLLIAHKGDTCHLPPHNHIDCYIMTMDHRHKLKSMCHGKWHFFIGKIRMTISIISGRKKNKGNQKRAKSLIT